MSVHQTPRPDRRAIHPAPPAVQPLPNSGNAQPQIRVIARSQSRPRRSLGALVIPVIALGLTAIFLIALLFGAGLFGYFQVSGRILPGVSVGSSAVGGMLITDAAVTLQETWNLDKEIIVTNGLHTEIISPSQLGLSLDALATVQLAYEVGHKDLILDRIGHLLVSLSDGWQIKPVLQYDEAAASAGLEALAPAMSLPARNASIRIEGSQLLAVPGEIGYTINMDETLAAIASDPQTVMEQSILQIHLQPLLPQVMDMTPVLDQAEQLIHTPASFRAYDALTDEFFDFPISQDLLVSWLTIETQGNQPVIGLDTQKMKPALNQMGETLGQGRYLRFQSLQQ